MKLRIEQGDVSRELEVPEGSASLGSGPLDELRLTGVPERFLRLHREGERLMVEGARVFSIDGVMVPSRVPRLLLAGERVQLPGGVQLTLIDPTEAEPPAGTVAMLKQFLGESDSAETLRVPHLICLTGLDVGRRFPLCDGTSAIGRGEEMTIRIRDRAVSRCHARVLKLDEGFALDDASLVNGVYVNGSRLASRTLLQCGDIIELGQSLLRFETGGPPAPSSLTTNDHDSQAAAPAPVAGSNPGRRRTVFGWSEWMLIAGGAVLTLIGLVVSLSLLR